MATGCYPRKPMSDATKAKIGASNRGKVRTPEVCAQMSEARRGRPQPCSAERAAAISAAKKGKPQSEAHRAANSASHKGQTVSEAHRAAISAAHKGKRRVFTEEWRANISRAGVGRIVSQATRDKRARSLRKAYEEGRKTVNKSYRYTSLAQSLHSYLVRDNGVSLEPEVRFGRYTVDLYDRVNHVAYEADGSYWHNLNEAKRPGYHAERDRYLAERFGLTVVHFDELQIAAMRVA